jgi:outer membrane cobalamin receptor
MNLKSTAEINDGPTVTGLTIQTTGLSNSTDSTPTKYRIPTIEITTPNTAGLEAKMSAARRDTHEIKMRATQKIKQLQQMDENREEERSTRNAREIDLESKVIQLGLRLQRLNARLGKEVKEDEKVAGDENN